VAKEATAACVAPAAAAAAADAASAAFDNVASAAYTDASAGNAAAIANVEAFAALLQ
jgi:hypothetical protein